MAKSGAFRAQAAIESSCCSTAGSLRAQAAMEYLVTYGWALLVIVIVIAVLLYINPFRAPEQCLFDHAAAHRRDIDARAGDAVERIPERGARRVEQVFVCGQIVIQFETGGAGCVRAGERVGRAALEACDLLIERLKVEVPVWKREGDEDGEHWVAGQTGHDTL